MEISPIKDENSKIDELKKEDEMKDILFKILSRTTEEDELFIKFREFIKKIMSADAHNDFSSEYNQHADPNILNSLNKKIKDYSKENEDLQVKNKELVALINKYQSDIEKIRLIKDNTIKKCKNFEQDIINLNNEIEIKNDTEVILKEKLEFVKGLFQEERSVYELYQSLEKDEISSLEGIFLGDTLEEFIYCGVQEKNLESMWEYLRVQAINGKDISKVTSIFIFFFRAFNKTYRNPIYELMDEQKGQDFDTNFHIRTGPDSKASGIITETILYGYKNCITGKVIKKTLVKI